MPSNNAEKPIRYIVRRVGQAILVWFLIITVNFFIFRIMPGDPRASLISEHMPPDVRQGIVERFGLDRPILEQFFLYIANLFRFEIGAINILGHDVPVPIWTPDLGISFSYFGQSVYYTIFHHRFMNTVLLMGVSLVISIAIGMVMGVLAAAKRGSKADTGSTIAFLVAYSIPVFWIGLLLLVVFGYHLQLIPIAGTITRGYDHINFLDYVRDYSWHMVGPAIVLVLSFIGGFYLIMRDSVLDVFTQDYMLAAEAKGLKRKTILYKHAMRNAMLPMVSVIAVNLPYLISGAIMTEFVFTWQGLGLLTYNAVLSNDYPVLQGIFLFLATITVVANLAADILYLYLDPRIRY
ncbi:ABC transporter permease [Candidatus Thorarchaeota archaeon]|nr:MAG: ABC transporter permease [Candidatus Thorarchaeota archaeon]